MATAGDLNGDGVNDVFVGSYDSQAVYAIDGKTIGAGAGPAKLLYPKITQPVDPANPQTSSLFSFYISVIGDVNNDAVNDLAVGGQFDYAGGAKGAGRLWMFSGKTGALLYTIDDPTPQAGDQFAYRLGRTSDVNGDGIPDLLVGHPNVDVPAGCSTQVPKPTPCSTGQGRAYIYSGNPADHTAGKTGLLRTFDMPASDIPAGGCGGANRCRFGVSPQSPGSEAGDPHIVVAAPYLNNLQGAIYVFSGKTGALLLRIADPVPQNGSFFGFQDVSPEAPGDVNGDGVPDVYGGAFEQNGPAPGNLPAQGRAWIFDGKTGAVLYGLDDPTPEDGGGFGFALATTAANLNATGAGGGVPPLLVGQIPHHANGSLNGAAYLFDGPSGALISSMELPAAYQQTGTATNDAPTLGQSLAAPGDLNGDGRNDYLAGAPTWDNTVTGNKDEGLVMSFQTRPTTDVAAVVGGDNALYVKRNDQAGYRGLDGILLATPATVPVVDAQGAAQPIYVGVGGDHRLYVRSDSATWTDLIPGRPVGCYDSPAALMTFGPPTNLTQPANLTIACRGGDQALYSWHTTVTAGALPTVTTDFQPLGGALLAGPAVAMVGGALTFFAEGTDHFIYTTTPATAPAYTKLQAACIGHPAAASNGTGVFAYAACQGLDGALYYSVYRNGGWGPFQSAGGQLIDGPAIALTDTKVKLYAEGLDQALYHTTVSFSGASPTPFAKDGGILKFGAGATGCPCPART